MISGPVEGDEQPCFHEEITSVPIKTITSDNLRFGSYEKTVFAAGVKHEYDNGVWILPSFNATEVTSFNFNLSYANGVFGGTYSEAGTYFTAAKNDSDQTVGTENNPYLYDSMANYSCSYNIQAYGIDEDVSPAL